MTSQQLKALIDELRKPQYQSLGDQEALDMVDSMTVLVKRRLYYQMQKQISNIGDK